MTPDALTAAVAASCVWLVRACLYRGLGGDRDCLAEGFPHEQRCYPCVARAILLGRAG